MDEGTTHPTPVDLAEPVDAWGAALAVIGAAQDADKAAGLDLNWPTETTDKRTLTKRRKERERRAALVAEADRRATQEQTVLAALAQGLSERAIAAQLNMSRKTVHGIFVRCVLEAPAPDVSEVRAKMHHRLEYLLQRLTTKVAAGDVAAIREAREITAEQLKIEAAYKPQPVDVSGEIIVRREVSVREAFSIVARIHADRITSGDAEMPALAAPATNGHGPGANGHEPATAA